MAILDADKEGFLRTETYLIQTEQAAREMQTARSSCIVMASALPCSRPWMKQNADERSRDLTNKRA